MMLKVYRIVFIIGVVLCIIGIVGCRAKTPEDIFITAQKALNSLKSYFTIITYRVMDGEEVREYRFKQWVSMPACFRIELISPDNLVGKSIVSDGREIVIEHSKIEDSLRFEVESLKQQRPLFIGDFLSSFWLSEDVNKRIHIEDGIEYVVLSCPSSEARGVMGNEELWLRAPKMVPDKMVTYDTNSDITSLILFEEFDGNWKAEQDFFRIND